MVLIDHKTSTEHPADSILANRAIEERKVGNEINTILKDI